MDGWFNNQPLGIKKYASAHAMQTTGQLIEGIIHKVLRVYPSSPLIWAFYQFLIHPTYNLTSFPIHKHEILDNTEMRDHNASTPPPTPNYYFFYCPYWRTLCPVHILYIQTQFPVLYSIQSILDKPFFLCMWRCSNFVFTKPTKSNARWILLNSMRKENTPKKTCKHQLTTGSFTTFVSIRVFIRLHVICLLQFRIPFENKNLA